MADILRAAQWMKEGKRVMRSSVAGTAHSMPVHSLVSPVFAESIFADEQGRIFTAAGSVAWFLLSGLLADDWEVAEP